MSLRLLLVEDDASTLIELGEILEKEGFTVSREADGKSGFETFQRVHPDVVITDLKMPGMTGLELMRKAKELRPDVPVILITAYGETDTAVEALRLGALDYFKKPIELGELLVAVGRAKEMVQRNRTSQDFPSVLLAEDDAVTRRNLAEVLEKEDWHVLQARDGRDAVDVFKSHRVDVLLIDLKMPRLDGIGALQEMRSLRQDFEAIILTGYGDESAAIQALRNGAMSFIRKPVDLEEVLVTLEKAIEKVGLSRALRYRNREVELARQIIAQITAHGEILLQVSESTLEQARKQVASALAYLSDGVAIVDSDLVVHFATPRLQSLFGTTCDRLDEAAMATLAASSGGRLATSDIRACVERALRGPLGGIERCGAGDDVSLVCVKARARVGPEASDYLFVVFLAAAR